MPLPAHPCPSLLSATPTLSSVSSPHCLYIPRPIIFHTSRPSAMPWSCMVLADLKQRYGHLNTRPRTAIAACIVTWQSSGPEVIAACLASAGLTAVACGPVANSHRLQAPPLALTRSGPCGPAALTTPRPRQAEGIPLTRRLIIISLIFWS